MKLSKKQKYLCEFFCAVLKSRLNFEDFQKKLTFIGNVFPKLLTHKKALA